MTGSIGVAQIRDVLDAGFAQRLDELIGLTHGHQPIRFFMYQQKRRSVRTDVGNRG